MKIVKVTKTDRMWDNLKESLNKTYRSLNQADEYISSVDKQIGKIAQDSDALRIGEEITDSWIPDLRQSLKEVELALNSLERKAKMLG